MVVCPKALGSHKHIFFGGGGGGVGVGQDLAHEKCSYCDNRASVWYYFVYFQAILKHGHIYPHLPRERR